MNVDVQMDETMKYLLDQVNINPGDLVSFYLSDIAEKDTGVFKLLVEVNGVIHTTAIAYHDRLEYLSDIQMLKDYSFQRITLGAIFGADKSDLISRSAILEQIKNTALAPSASPIAQILAMIELAPSSYNTIGSYMKTN